MGISVPLHYRRLSVHLYLWQLLLWITFLSGHSLRPLLTYFSSFVFLHSVLDPGRFASREKESNKWDAGVWQAKWDGQNSTLWCWISCQGPARCPLTTSGDLRFCHKQLLTVDDCSFREMLGTIIFLLQCLCAQSCLNNLLHWSSYLPSLWPNGPQARMVKKTWRRKRELMQYLSAHRVHLRL